MASIEMTHVLYSILAELEMQKRPRFDTRRATPQELARYLRVDMAKWWPVIRDANIRLDG
jgi:hypothetical protein